MRDNKPKGEHPMSMNMKSNKAIAEFICLFFFLMLLSGTSGASEIYDFNPGWMFMQSDQQIAPKDYKEHKSIWAGAKATTSDAIWPFSALKFDESEFHSVNLPHDWSVEDGFYPEENGEQGYRKRGWGYYRKRFFVPSTWKGKHVELQFEGNSAHITRSKGIPKSRIAIHCDSYPEHKVHTLKGFCSLYCQFISYRIFIY